MIPFFVSQVSYLISWTSSLIVSVQKLGAGPQFYKCFVSLNKHRLEPLIALVQQKSTAQLKDYLTKQRESVFSSFFLSSHEKNHS